MIIHRLRWLLYVHKETLPQAHTWHDFPVRNLGEKTGGDVESFWARNVHFLRCVAFVRVWTSDCTCASLRGWSSTGRTWRPGAPRHSWKVLPRGCRAGQRRSFLVGTELHGSARVLQPESVRPGSGARGSLARPTEAVQRCRGHGAGKSCHARSHPQMLSLLREPGSCEQGLGQPLQGFRSAEWALRRSLNSSQ